MTSRQHNRHIDAVIAALEQEHDRERFTEARSLLKQYLIHTREIPNGRDFLFAAPTEPLLDALRDLRTLEYRCSRFLLFDYAQIDEYFLLRIVGQPEHQPVIESYFE